ncbi:DUF2779 domain-containing protein [Mycoplasma phocoeninasale]|uniref:DUF2779 domain-containing protein n=1 Tax=Mycoplasma phocoeninasale TaxID=2726117 RepID=A0A858U150_9MOLU|nr:DUF2779 domain-containing protein [Mycoplasma phocoeninasale]QJG66132.1 DUF2779 domain-containing protein [Mycoplasma phocoeninasale]
MNSKKYYKFLNYAIMNSARPYFAFNTSLEQIYKNFNEEYDDDTNIFNQLDYQIDCIEGKIESEFGQFFTIEDREEIDKRIGYEKLAFLKDKLANDNKFYNEVVKHNKLTSANELIDKISEYKALAMGLGLVTNRAIEFLKNDYFHDREVEVISCKQSKDKKIEQTKLVAESDKILINPAFEYKSCISIPFFYDSKTKTVALLLYSSKTSLKNIFRLYYDVNVIRAAGYEVKEAVVVLPKYQERKNARKGHINFLVSEYANYKKSKPTYDTKKSFSESEIQAIFIKDPNFKYSSKGLKKTAETNVKIIDHINSELSAVEFFDKGPTKRDTFPFKKFVEIVNDEELLKKYSAWVNELNENDLEDDLNLGNQFYLSIVEKLLPNYLVSSKVILRLKLQDLKEPNFKSRTILDFYENNKIALNPDIENYYVYKKISEKDAKIIWFDFEGVTLPIPIIDFNKPYNQLMSQTSIIKTINNEIYNSHDYVYDPKNYDYKTLIKIIDDLYDEEASCYVVYNKSYETSRLLEMQEMLLYYHEKSGVMYAKEYEKIAEKIQFIVTRIVDIAELFMVGSHGMKISKSQINLGELKGKYSIKKIEQYVSSNKIKLNHMIFPYKDLNVKNGGMALQISTARALDVIKDNEWEQEIIALKKYCHNDVLAMIMAFDLAQHIIKSPRRKEYINNFEKYKNWD